MKAQPTTLADRVRAALGRYITPNIRTDEGETPIRRMVWSLHELTEIHSQFPQAPVTARAVTCTSESESYPATEITLTIELPDLGRVEVFTLYGGESEYPNGVPGTLHLTSVPAATV